MKSGIPSGGYCYSKTAADRLVEYHTILEPVKPVLGEGFFGVSPVFLGIQPSLQRGRSSPVTNLC
jgi:hypothetical protein